MSFRYVDRILEWEPRKRIRGLKNVTRTEEFFYLLPDGRRVLSPAAISEALAQLGGWLKMASTEFTKRPVLLGDDFTEYPDFAVAGDQVELLVEVLSFDEDVVVTRGIASVGGRVIVQSHECRGFLMNIEEFCDPVDMARQFQTLFRPELKDKPIEAPQWLWQAPIVSREIQALRFVDGVTRLEPYARVQGFKNFTSSESFFTDHFPRKPVVPGVLQLSFVGEVCQFLIRENTYAVPLQKALIPTHIQRARFRKFVEPGDQCMASVEVRSGNPRERGEKVLVGATLFANKQRVMQVDMGFVVMGAAS